jgi:hypothetical protein
MYDSVTTAVKTKDGESDGFEVEVNYPACRNLAVSGEEVEV